MIYTSGSTGRPKGAVNTHRAIRNRLLWMQAAYGLTAADRVLQKTPISFDVSVWEFFWPLTTGARLVLARPGGHLDPAYLAGLIAEEGVTTLHFVPSLLQLFLAEPGLERCTALRRVICSGEALPAELVQRFFDRFPEPAELHNLYGPTEAAVDVTAWPCRREVRGIREARIPIGHPVANTQIHLLDPFFQLVPVGTPGELCIGGVQLARGYHNRPELTAERFVPDPFGTAGSRLYRTGDLARRLPDGAVDYLGRLDFQVKVRGVRIELGEIEAALRAHPAVRDAAVTAGGDQRLAAYVVPVESPVGSEARDLLIADLRDALRSRLPEPMLPTAYVLLDALPLTPSGKLDRRALPAPETALPDRAAAFVAPRNETEEMLAAIWAEVLGVERVGIHDNFLELGGHSLFAMQLISRVRAAFAVELPLRSLFDANTVAALAVRIVTAQAEQADRAALERMLAELEGISDSEAQSLLAGGDEQS
jgi:acyl-coenzyme A synthetase/AMP-(fatty) acid ligase/acyl carrier protein